MLMLLSLLLILLLLIGAGASFLYIRRLKHTLWETQKRASLLDHVPTALIVVNTSQRIVQWNLCAHTMFGYTNSEALGRDMVDLIVPLADRAHVVSILTKAFKEGNSVSKNFNMTKEKEELFCEWRNRRYHDTVICTVQDITSSKKVLEDLSKRSTALESSGEAILYTNHKGMIEFANRSFFTLCPSPQNDIFQSHIGEYLFGSIQAMNAKLPQFDADNTWKGTIQ
jgi:PAS domain S-box-containing protein